MALAAIATRVLYNDGASETVLNVVFIFALVNLLLAVFNFLPIPPLDGASLIERALPESWLPGWYRFRPYGIAVLFLLIFVTPFFDWVFDPLVRLLRDFVTG
jgi:Zn-dependent protease